MAFRFSLETVLRLRRSLEERERLRLATLLARRSELELEVGRAEELRTGLKAKLQLVMSETSLPAGEMQLVEQRTRGCELHARRLRAALATLAQEIARQTAAYVEQRRDREVLENVRQQQQRRYETEAQRRSQARLEELVLLRLAARFPAGNDPSGAGRS